MHDEPKSGRNASHGDDAGAILGRLHQAVDDVRDRARGEGDLERARAVWQAIQTEVDDLETLRSGRRSEDLLDRLSFALDEVEQAARSIFRDSEANDEVVARRLAVLRAASRLLRRLARILEGRPARDETPFLLQELRELDRVLAGNTAAVDVDAEGTDELESEVDHVRFEVLERQARTLLEAAAVETACDAESVARLFRISRALRRITADLQDCAADGGEELRARLTEFAVEAAAEQNRLQALYLGWMQAIATEAELKAAGDAVLWLTGELDEARIGLAERAGFRRVQALQRLRLDGLQVQRAFRRARRRVESELKSQPPSAAGEESTAAPPTVVEEGEDRLFTVRRIDLKLRRTTTRLRNALADRVLSLRLERLFGRRAVRLWEILIFWLIMAVIGLIVVDHFSESVPEGEIGWTTWADTAICAVLLLDFFVRLSLSPERIRYFRRNFFTEFLPSLPFSMLLSLDAIGLPMIRGVRVVRLVRALRVLRPLLRIFRLFLFLARAADRLVERNAWLLNQNIVFFSDPVRESETPTLLNRARELDNWIARGGERRMLDLAPTARREGCRWQLGLLEMEIPSRTSVALATMPLPTRAQVRDLHADDVIGRLRDLDDNQVADFVGHDVARQITSSLSFFRLPLLRRLPVVRFLLGPTGAPDPLWTTARLGRMAGDLLAWLQRLLNWFADLYGTITGAQFLDRLGMSLMKATARPAKRLLLFAVVIFVIIGFAHLTRFDPLIAGVDGLTGILAGPLLFIGLICFVPLGLGAWLRRIAGQAVDLFDRVAEAQFLALTEILKEERSATDLALLVDRVLVPEVVSNGDEGDDLSREREILLAAARGSRPDVLPVSTWAFDTMMLFYRDFIDGAPFHRNDTKVANMLLGNLTLENIRRVRLKFDAKRFRQLDRLDIARGKGGLTGPKVWFDFITHSVSQHVARLIIEYNQHCIPVTEIESAHAEDRRLFELWLDRRRRLSQARRRGESVRPEDMPDVSGTAGTLLYRTTEFNALHFLTASKKMDESVRERYGDEVAALLAEDRENLVRDIFGTFPMQDLPKEKRTLNPYVQYRRYFARGRVFIFPQSPSGSRRGR